MTADRDPSDGSDEEKRGLVHGKSLPKTVHRAVLSACPIDLFKLKGVHPSRESVRRAESDTESLGGGPAQSESHQISVDAPAGRLGGTKSAVGHGESGAGFLKCWGFRNLWLTFFAIAPPVGDFGEGESGCTP